MITAAGPRDGRGLLGRAWWLHPLLLAAFPVLFLFAVNIREQVSAEPLVAPPGLAVGVATLLLVLAAAGARLVGSSAPRAALVVSLVVVLFFAYGHVWPTVKEAVGLHRNLLAIWAAIGLAGTVLAARAPVRAVRATTAGLNIAALALVAINLVPVVQWGLTSSGVTMDEARTARSGETDAAPRPDIWYLVPDRYAGQSALEEIYRFDNRPFLDDLESRGFAIAEHATANYLKTAHSLASTLNLDELDGEELLEEATAPDDWGPLYRRLQSTHAVEQFLHDRGYTYLHLGIRRGATYTNAAADRVFLYADRSEFTAVLLETTILVALENVIEDEGPAGINRLYAEGTLYQLDVLEQLARVRSDRPRFVFAHLLLPHPPYVFNANGSWVTPEQAAARSREEAYLEQLQFANSRILGILDRLLEADTGDDGPIVLIQSDEGPFPDRYARDEEGFDWTQATRDELLRKFSILAAYRVPGVSAQELDLTPTVTPVNSFRLIFNAVFDARLPRLPDRNWIFQNQRELYDLIDFTDRVPRG